jgi:ABC-type polysaccharide/polyol phosphate export permease
MFIGINTVFVRDLVHIVQVIIPTFMYALPIIYQLEAVPVSAQIWFKLNPFFHLIELFRSVIYRGQLPVSTEWLICGAIALLSFLLGLWTLFRHNDDLVYRY